MTNIFECVICLNDIFLQSEICFQPCCLAKYCSSCKKKISKNHFCFYCLTCKCEIIKLQEKKTD